jgi:diacylglycerol kinase
VIKTIKDVSAGAVVLAVLAAVICGCIIFLPKLYALIF